MANATKSPWLSSRVNICMLSSKSATELRMLRAESLTRARACRARRPLPKFTAAAAATWAASERGSWLALAKAAQHVAATVTIPTENRSQCCRESLASSLASRLATSTASLRQQQGPLCWLHAWDSPPVYRATHTCA